MGSEGRTGIVATASIAAMPALYFADGHHRSAATSRVATARQAPNPEQAGEESYDSFLSVIFPAHQMRILDYNRVAKDLDGVTEPAFMSRVAERGPGRIPKCGLRLGRPVPRILVRRTLSS